ncbi:ParB/RepB/Spo0J family partition protein [Actinomadura fibrosa]|uniref:ParB N-terminal domain-containing protein n=1 Tax=Actinomadura fibrosa TaxID=111802 RepID=A0ABW2X9T0_9ACTN|nr:ParB/RepB/Spo0J family partition protein [Actinomadura fibrosa]
MAGGDGQATLVADGIDLTGSGAAGSGAGGPDADGPAAGDGLDLRNFERLPACEVAVDALSPGLGLRQSGTNAAHVQLLIDASGTAELPPLLVQEDGWRVIDGLHRLEAARLRGDAVVRARFVDCTDSEALVLAMKANSAHGLPLSKADRVYGATSVLAAHPDWSDRAIATITGLSAKTIASLRSRSAGAARLGGKRLGRDGKRRPVTLGEGRLRAAEYITAHPDASLRQVAKATDVSLGTVHDVSARLRRGANPERDGHRTPAAQPPTGSPSTAQTAGAQPIGTQPTGEPTSGMPTSGMPEPGTRTHSDLTHAGRTHAGRPHANRAHSAPGPRPAAFPGGGAGGTPLRRKNHTDLPPTWPQTVAKMANDPAVRYTDSGREFLRWMSLHASDPHRWREFLNTIPPHWQTVIAPIADSISQEWSLFAQRLQNEQETA